MQNSHFDIKEAKQIDMVEYLEQLGYKPQKIRNNDHWYLSPFRKERTPSFKVSRKLNIWFDHGLGKGGNLIDFGVLYHQCSVGELLHKLATANPISFSFHPPLSSSTGEAIKRGADEKEKIQVVEVRDLKSAVLIGYLEQRKIPIDIAGKHCKEVEFELYNKRHTAIGFGNNSGGYELRNGYFKGSSSPKDVTLLDQENSPDISVFEGFFSFLSYQALLQKDTLKAAAMLPKEQPNYLVLNSLSFFEKSKAVMEKQSLVYLFLDRDTAGIKTTLQAIASGKQYYDKSHLYTGYKDLNDFLLHFRKQEQKHRLRQGRHP